METHQDGCAAPNFNLTLRVLGFGGRIVQICPELRLKVLDRRYGVFGNLEIDVARRPGRPALCLVDWRRPDGSIVGISAVLHPWFV